MQHLNKNVFFTFFVDRYLGKFLGKIVVIFISCISKYLQHY